MTAQLELISGPAISMPSGIVGVKMTEPPDSSPETASVMPGISMAVVGPQETTEMSASKSAIAENSFFLIIFVPLWG